LDKEVFNPLNAELNPICHLLALLGAHHTLHVSGLRVKPHTCFRLMRPSSTKKNTTLSYYVKDVQL